MKKRFVQGFCCLLLLAVINSCTTPTQKTPLIELVQNGQTQYKIVVPDSPAEPEKTAAQELRKYIKEMTSANLEIINEKDFAGTSPSIFVGHTKAAENAIKSIDFTSLKNDRIIIYTTGKNIVISGACPRGTLYAVYTFLEDICGCRWWTATESFIPKMETLTIPELKIDYIPPLSVFRATHYFGLRNLEFAVKMKSNDFLQNIPSRLGGHFECTPYLCHTFFKLVPPGKYFARHPEWFSLYDGVPAQLCLANDDCRKELIRNALDYLRKNPHIKFLVVSPEDKAEQSRCKCARCLAIEKLEGAPSGPLLRFVNAVAEDINKEFPDVKVITTAYSYTRKPPLVTKAGKNIIVLLSTSRCQQNTPITDKTSKLNADFIQDMQGWKNARPSCLLIWDYQAKFHDFLLPNPNVQIVGENIRYFANNEVSGIFEQGDNYCAVGDFIRLKAWVTAHLLWNPSLDENKLIDEFLNGYYGQAAPYLRSYLDMMHKASLKTDIPPQYSSKDISFLTPEFIEDAYKDFKLAENAVKNDPVLQERVKRERIPLDYAAILAALCMKEYDLNRMPDHAGNIKDAISELLKNCKKQNVQKTRETHGDFKTFVAVMTHALPVPLPEMLKGLTEYDYFDFQEYLLTPYCKIVNDPDASNELAAYMPGNSPAWGIQYNIQKQTSDIFPRGKIYLVVKCEKTGTGKPEDRAFEFGICDSTTQKYKSRKVTLGEVKSNAYELYELPGIHEINQRFYIWVCPPASKNIESIRVDRAVLVRAKKLSNN